MRYSMNWFLISVIEPFSPRTKMMERRACLCKSCEWLATMLVFTPTRQYYIVTTGSCSHHCAKQDITNRFLFPLHNIYWIQYWLSCFIVINYMWISIIYILYTCTYFFSTYSIFPKYFNIFILSFAEYRIISITCVFIMWYFFQPT